MRNPISKLTILAAGLLLPTLSNANFFAGLFYAKVKVKTESEVIAGLDEPTRKLISTLPSVVRADAVKFVADALPMVDESLGAFVGKVDFMLETRVNHLVCASQAAFQGMAEELKGTITGNRPQPIENLVKDYDEREGRFSKSTARDIAISYEGFLQQAAIISCRLVDSSAAQRVDNIRLQSREKWRTWSDLEDFCGDPHDCLVKRYAIVKTMVEGADQRDVQVANSLQALSQVTVLQRPKLWFSSDIKSWLSFEHELVKLRSIQRVLNTATALRTSVAQRYLTDAEDMVLAFEKAISGARGRLSTNLVGENDAARNIVVAALANEANVVDQVVRARTGDPSLKSRADELEARFNASKAGALVVADAAQGNNAKIASIAAADAQRARDRQVAAAAEIKRNQDIIDRDMRMHP